MDTELLKRVDERIEQLTAVLNGSIDATVLMDGVVLDPAAIAQYRDELAAKRADVWETNVKLAETRGRLMKAQIELRQAEFRQHVLDGVVRLHARQLRTALERARKRVQALEKGKP